MTVIVASTRHRQMAADTLIVDGYDVAGYASKIVRGKDGSLGGACGDAAGCCEFLEWVEGGREGKLKSKLFRDTLGLVLSPDNRLLVYGCNVPDKLLGKYHAIGAGAAYATTVLALGISPAEAVKTAIKHSTACGGRVEVLKL